MLSEATTSELFERIAQLEAELAMFNSITLPSGKISNALEAYIAVKAERDALAKKYAIARKAWGETHDDRKEILAKCDALVQLLLKCSPVEPFDEYRDTCNVCDAVWYNHFKPEHADDCEWVATRKEIED